MNNATRLIYLQVKRLGGAEASRRRRSHHVIGRNFTRHRRRAWWALHAPHALPSVERYC